MVFCWKSCEAARPPGLRLDLCGRSNEQHRQISDREEKWGAIKQNGSLRVLRRETSLWASASWVKFMLPFSFASHYQRSAAMKGFDIERTAAAEAESSRRSWKYGGGDNGGNGESRLFNPVIWIVWRLKCEERLTRTYKTAALWPDVVYLMGPPGLWMNEHATPAPHLPARSFLFVWTQLDFGKCQRFMKMDLLTEVIFSSLQSKSI